MPKLYIKLVEDNSVEDILVFDTEEEVEKQEREINKHLNKDKYYTSKEELK